MPPGHLHTDLVPECWRKWSFSHRCLLRPWVNPGTCLSVGPSHKLMRRGRSYLNRQHDGESPWLKCGSSLQWAQGRNGKVLHRWEGLSRGEGGKLTLQRVSIHGGRLGISAQKKGNAFLQCSRRAVWKEPHGGWLHSTLSRVTFHSNMWLSKDGGTLQGPSPVFQGTRD